MEALSVKAGILASLFGFLGIIGLAILLASVIWLIIRVANFDSVLPALLCVVISLGLIAGGLFSSPAPDYQPEPLKMPWESLLDWVVGLRTGKTESEEPSEGDEPAAPEGDAPAETENDAPSQPEMEKMDVVHTSAPVPEGADLGSVPAEGAEPAVLKAEVPPEAAKPAAEQARVLVDEVLNGWRVRLTLPREWKDLCVVENNGTYLSFTHKASISEFNGEYYGGELFSLSVVESPVDFESEDYIYRDSEIVLEKEGMALVLTGATDIPATEDSIDEYTRLYDDIRGNGENEAILNTIEFERA